MKTLCDSWLTENAGRIGNPNPCVRMYGAGPVGKQCRECVKLYAKQFSKKHYKCSLRRDTNGPGTDHRARWDACGKFEEQIGAKR